MLQFAVGANGNVAPSGVLTGSATGLYDPEAFSLGLGYDDHVDGES